MTDTDNQPGGEPGGFANDLRVLGGGFAGLFCLALSVSVAVSQISRATFKPVPALIATAAMVIGVLALRMMYKALGGRWLANSPRQRANQIVIYVMVLFGAAAGALIQLGEHQTGHKSGHSILSYDAPLPPAVAAVLLALIPILLWLTLRWHRNADEHEVAAYNAGAVTALHAWFFASTGWWIAWRGGLLPEPDGFALFWMVMAVWTLGWAWRRYR